MASEAAQLASMQQELRRRKADLQKEMQRLQSQPGGESRHRSHHRHKSHGHHRGDDQKDSKHRRRRHRDGSKRHGSASRDRSHSRSRHRHSRSPSRGREGGRKHVRGHGHSRGSPRGKHQSGTTPAQHAINQAQARVEAEGQARLDQAAAELHRAQEQLDARTKSLHAARVELADNERSVEAAKAQLTTLIGMTKDLLQMLRPASDTHDGAAAASADDSAGRTVAEMLGAARNKVEGDHAVVEEFIERRMRSIAAMVGSADNETDDQALSDEAWHALQANIGEWERGRAQELAAAGVDGLEALAAAVGDAPDDGTPQDSAANTSTLDVDVHKLSAVLLQSVPRVGEQ